MDHGVLSTFLLGIEKVLLAFAKYHSVFQTITTEIKIEGTKIRFAHFRDQITSKRKFLLPNIIFAHFWDQITMDIQFPIQNFISAQFWDNRTHNTPDNTCGMITRQIAHDEKNAYLFQIFSEKVKIFKLHIFAS